MNIFIPLANNLSTISIVYKYQKEERDYGNKRKFAINIDEIIRRKEDIYVPIATKNAQYLRRKQIKHEEPIIRPPFYRDSDRIIHSRAYARYIDKTQVFFLVDNDHVTHRVLHVQLVSKIARTIGRSLSLNEV